MRRRFVESRGFSDDRKRLERERELSDEDMRALEQSILADPEVGDLVPGTGGLRKARVAQRSVRRGAQGSRGAGEAAQGGAVKRKAKASAFSKIKAGLEDAIAFHAGERELTVRDVELSPPPPMGAKEVLAVRRRMRVSQAAFARILNVSSRTVQAWETDARRPSDAALKLLSVAEKHPEALLG